MFGNIGTEDWILITLVALVILLFIGTLISIIKNKYFDKTHKLYWIIALIFLPLHAPFLYLFIGREERIINQ